MDSDSVDDAIESLTDAISTSTMLEWTAAIEKTVKQNCDRDLSFKGVADGEGHFHIEFDGTSDDTDCLIRSIRQHMDGMHPMTQAFFERLIEIYQSDRGQENDSRP